MTSPNPIIVEGPNAYAADPCVPEDASTPRLVTDSGVEFVRTPESAFANLEGGSFPWEPNYATLVEEGGLRMHYVDAGPQDAEEVILLLHGQPTWSYLYRKMVPVLTERGYRVICPDWIGMGRSDKPTKLAEHTYLKHVARLKEFITIVIPEATVKPTITVFFQDWGSLIGFRVVGDEPDWFRRVVSANGYFPVLPEGANPYAAPTPVNYNCSDSRSFMQMAIERFSSQPCGLDQTCFSIWIEYALTSPSLQASDVVAVASNTTSGVEGYDAPFPSFIYKAGIRAFPSMIAAIIEPEFGNLAAWASLQNFSRPFLALAGENDPNLGSAAVQNNLIDNIPGSMVHSFKHKRYPGAGHFIQEDAGAEVAAHVADFVEGTTTPPVQKDAPTTTTTTTPAPSPAPPLTSGAARNQPPPVSVLVFAIVLALPLFRNKF